MTADELKAKIDLEGDRKDFTYKEHECRVLRMPITGHLCGYVGVCTSSSLHGIDYGSLDSVEVHGGLTYSGEMPDSDKWIKLLISKRTVKMTTAEIKMVDERIKELKDNYEARLRSANKIIELRDEKIAELAQSINELNRTIKRLDDKVALLQAGMTSDEIAYYDKED